MTNEEVKTIIEELLRRLNVSFDSIDVGKDAEREVFSIKSNDSHLLIGSHGAHLFALSHLVKKIVWKKDREKQFSLDVNDYQGKASENLKTKAKIMGERARELRTNVELEPMSSYERMVIHAFFQDAKDVKTESIGEGGERRVVIKYVESTNN
jgi:spoIIIJ-associated protein